MTRRYFGTDGIRGLANRHPMTSEVALKVGMAAGKLFQNGNHRHRVVIGKDTRLSGYMLEAALMSGFTAVGMDVFLLGPMPTPAVAMLTRSLRADLGVMISASHNRYDDNGIKLFDPDGYKLSDDTERDIERMIEADATRMLAAPDRIGRATRVESAQERYIEYAKRTPAQELEAQRPAHRHRLRQWRGLQGGARSPVGARRRSHQDRRRSQRHNINYKCGSTAPEALIEKVREVRADIGIALDGDADRVVIVDEKGSIVDGDQLMAVIAESWHRRGKLAAGGIVATVMSNLGLERYLKSQGLSLARTPVGDRYVVEHMRKHGYNIGGEQSGHIVLSDFTTTGDGLVSALQVLACVVATGKPVSEVCARFTPLPQILQNVRYANGKPLEDRRVMTAIEGAKKRLGEAGRLVIRPSGTEPVIRVMAEGDDELLVSTVVGDIVEAVEEGRGARGLTVTKLARRFSSPPATSGRSLVRGRDR